MHVVAEFGARFPEQFQQWYKSSNSVVCLSTKTEQELYHLKQRLEQKNLDVISFREPDVGGFITALGLVPGPNNKKLLSNYPLAGKQQPEQVGERIKQRKKIIQAMSDCFQDKNKTQTVLQHGQAVFTQFNKLLAQPETHGLKTITTEEMLTLQSFIIKDLWVVESYAVMHDMGKPFCVSVEQPGSFPDHANVSADLWRTISDNKQVEELIRTDMLFHTARTKQELETCSTREQLATLAIMSLAELQSNAITLFGGFDSDSYKIKRKRLEKNIRFALELLQQ